MPTLVRGVLENKAVVQVALGDNHSACVAEDGSVYTWGRNNQGQLGVAGMSDTFLPMLVQELDINACNCVVGDTALQGKQLVHVGAQ